MSTFNINDKNYNIPNEKISEYWSAMPYAKLTEGTIHSLLEERVKLIPNETALVYKNKKTSFDDLNKKSNTLAHYLIDKYDMQPDDKIALFLDRTDYMFIGMIGALKSGAAYVPMDVNTPEARLAHMLSEVTPKAVLASCVFKNTISDLKAKGLFDADVLYIDDESFVKTLNDTMSIENPITKTKPHDLAYIIYTSGTTGTPKGVMIEHGNAVCLFVAVRKLYLENIDGYATMQRFLCYNNYVFDAHVLEIYPALIDGKTLYLLNSEEKMNIPFMRQLVVDNNIECVALPTVLLDKDYTFPVKIARTGGETPNQEMVNSYLKQNIYVLNTYGPTEITVASNIRIYLDGDKSNNIGALLFNYTGYVLDYNMKLLPPGAIGELYIGGNGVGRGYLNNPELTAERFLPNPFQTEKEKIHDFNSRIYKTGDLVKSLPDGSYEYLGRNDSQVKIRGFRIELGEIESAIMSYPDIKHAAVVAKEPSNGMTFLAGYYTSDQEIDDDLLNDHLQKLIPEYMIPAIYVRLDEFPMNSSGKIDKKAFPEVHILDKEEFCPPQNETEKELCQIYSNVLNLDVSTIGINNDFFKLGGNSILAIKLVDKITKIFNKELPLGDVFTCKTIHNISEKLLNIEENHEEIVVPKINSPEEQVLSFAQERLWFIDKFEKESSTYNIPIVLKLKKETNIDSLVDSINTVIKRHQILRTLIRTNQNGDSYQLVDNKELEIKKFKLKSIDELNQYLIKALDHIFHLSSEYPIHVEIYSIGDAMYMSIIVHHIAFDGWSMDILLREVINYYKYHQLLKLGKKDEAQNYLLPDLNLQYKDFALWQRDYLKGDKLEKQLEFWKYQLSGYEGLNLSTDKIRPSQVNYAGDDIYFDLDTALSNDLRYTAQELGISLYTLLLGGFYILLSTYSNQDDIVVGTASANRNRSEISDIIGFFVNTLALRRTVDGDKSIVKFLKETGDFLFSVQNNQDLPFEKLVDELHIKKDLSRHPIFQVLFGLQSFGNEQNEERDSLFEIYPVETEVDFHIAKFDLSLMMNDASDKIIGSFNYQTSLFEADTIQSYIKTYKNILQQLSQINAEGNKHKKISDLSFLDKDDFKQIAFDWNQTSIAPESGETLHSSFEKQAQRTPDNIAIVSEGRRLTYREVNEKSTLLAAYIKDKYNIQPDDMVALYLSRSEFIPIAILAVMKAGAAYVPMDPSSPTERLTYMLTDTAAKLVFTTMDHQSDLKELETSSSIEVIDTPNLFDDLKETYSTDKLITQVTPNNLAYIIYTSGTTGNPKGVMVEHHSVIRLFEAGTKLYNFNDKDVWSLFHSYTFDFSVWELWGSLLFGGKLIIPSYEDTRNIPNFYNLCKSEGLTILNQTPSAFYQFVDAAIHDGNKIDSLRYVIFGGEALNTPQLKPWFDMYPENKPYLVNMYGITETTVFATYPKALKKSELDRIPLIGVTMDGYTSYVIDKYNRILPIGAIGELYLGGVGVTRGYLNNPDLTKERFVANPFQTEDDKKRNFNAQLYKSGDLVKLTQDGDLQYIGRNDFQVKIRGFRIELEEISTRLSQMSGIKQSIVLVKEHSDDIKYIVAYYLSEKPIDSHDIHIYMSQYLPDYMIPSFFVHLTDFPLTLNGKLDTRALPEPTYTQEYIAPRNEAENQLCDIFAEVLKIDSSKISVNADFFDLGGNSIVAAKLIYNINSTLNVKIRIIDIFMNRTIEKLAELINQHSSKTVVSLNDSSSKSLMFMVHPGGGGCEAYLSLANSLKSYYKCYGLESYNIYNTDKMIGDLHTLASLYVEYMDKIKISSSYTLLGWSLGGLIALEIAAILESRGITDIKVYLLDTIINNKEKGVEVAMCSDEEIRKITDKYDGLDFDTVKRLLVTENNITNQNLSHKLVSTKVLLFKALLNNKDWNESNMYLLDNVLQNMNLLNVVKIEDATHDNILDHENIIVQNIIEDRDKKILNRINPLTNNKFTKPLIIFLPFAGGNALSYRDLNNALQEKYEIICPEILGRGSLVTEDPLENLDAIADYVFNEWIKPLDLSSSYVIYGHSMGALLGYILLKKIEANHLTLPQHLIVSGKAAPSVKPDNNWHKLPSKEFWESLNTLGGMSDEILNDDELKQYFEAILRADFKAVETYCYEKPQKPSEVPITVLYGSGEIFSEDTLDGWKNETTKEVRFIKMQGTHFFIYDHTSEIADIIDSTFS